MADECFTGAPWPTGPTLAAVKNRCPDVEVLPERRCRPELGGGPLPSWLRVSAGLTNNSPASLIRSAAGRPPLRHHQIPGRVQSKGQLVHVPGRDWANCRNRAALHAFSSACEANFRLLKPGNGFPAGTATTVGLTAHRRSLARPQPERQRRGGPLQKGARRPRIGLLVTPHAPRLPPHPQRFFHQQPSFRRVIGYV